MSNSYITDDGYKVYKNVKSAHLKPMKYLTDDGFVFISNSKEFLDDGFLKSMIGKPLVVKHPKDFVDNKNYKDVIKGSIINAYNVDNDLLTDIIVYDKETQEMIDNGLREVSIGVTGTLSKIDDLNYIKHPVNFNHIALVEKGRAGSDYRFVDAMEDIVDKEEKITLSTSFFERLFGGKKEVAEEPKKEFVDAAVVEDLKQTVLALSEKVDALSKKFTDEAPKQEVVEEKTTEFNDDIMSAVKEFIPSYTKDGSVELGVRTALTLACNDKVGSFAKSLLNNKDIATMPFEDASSILLSVFEAKKLVNNTPIKLEDSVPSNPKRITTASQLNELYNGGNK